MCKRTFNTALFLLPFALLNIGVAPAVAQTFDTVINLPDHPVFGDVISGDLGGDGQTTQLNVENFGLVGPDFDANSGTEVNIIGGTVGGVFDANSGSVVNVSGGSVCEASNDRFSANSGSEVNISGGTVSGGLDANSGSVVNVSGGKLVSGSVRFGGVVNVSGGTVSDGSTARFSAGSGGVLNISGGTVDNQFNASPGSVVNLSGGTVGISSTVRGCVLNISGGTMGDTCRARSESVVNISGGTVGSSFTPIESAVNISGGAVGRFFRPLSGSVVKISGGRVGSDFNYDGDSADNEIEIVGGEFRVNNAAYNASTFTLATGDVFTGVLADGSAFIFTRQSGDRLLNATLTSVALPVPDLTPIVVDTVNPNRPSGLRTGQSLTVLAGGELRDNFEAVNATLNIEGGTLGHFAGAAGSEVNIGGGTVGYRFDANSGSEVNISGGTVGVFFDANSGSVVNISGGTVGSSFTANAGSEVNINGGTVGDLFNAYSGSVVNLFGRDFVLDRLPLGDLVPGEAFTIKTSRFATLSGLLEDGTAFGFDLNELQSRDPSRDDIFAPEPTLTVTLRTSVLQGDVDQNGFVNFLDISPFISVLSSRDFQDEADINRDGRVNFLDISPFIRLLTS